MIKQREGKITRKQAMGLGAISQSVPYVQPYEIGEQLIARFPVPNLKSMSMLEWSPGLWVFDDPTGIVFLIWSCAHRKHNAGGTYVEVIASATLTQQHGVGAFHRLTQLLRG